MVPKMKERMKAALVLAGLASLFSGLVIFTLLTLIAIWSADARWLLTGIVGSGFFLPHRLYHRGYRQRGDIMAQNLSFAVMQQRHEVRGSLDDFPTPPWATRALCEHILPQASSCGVKFDLAALKRKSAYEPACNRGYMARPLAEYFGCVYTSDIADYSDIYIPDAIGWDFAAGEWATDEDGLAYANGADYAPEPDAVITNPPFNLAEAFIARSLAMPGVKLAAFFVRSSFLESVGRYERLFRDTPPAIFAPFAERVPLVKGRYDPAASTATSYCWLVWRRAVKHDGTAAEGKNPWYCGGTEVIWIPPCRKVLEKCGDCVQQGGDLFGGAA